MQTEILQNAVKNGLLTYDETTSTVWLMYESETYYHYWHLSKEIDITHFDSDTKEVKDLLTPYGFRDCLTTKNEYWEYNEIEYYFDSNDLAKYKYFEVKKLTPHGSQSTLSI